MDLRMTGDLTVVQEKISDVRHRALSCGHKKS